MSLTSPDTSSPLFFFFSSRRRHTRCSRDWSSDVCSSDLRLHSDNRKTILLDIAELPDRLRDALQDLKDPQLDTQYRPEGWTLRQVVHHVARSEERRVRKDSRSRRTTQARGRTRGATTPRK